MSDNNGMKKFFCMWIAQFITMIGSGLTGFALGVWVFELTGSVTKYSMIALFTTLPGILISPVAGAIVDRWDRRKTIVLCDLGAGLCIILLIILVFKKILLIWHIYVIMTIISSLTAFRWPAYVSSISLIVSKQKLSKANAMDQMSSTLAQVIAPIIAGIVVKWFGLLAVIAINFLTYIAALFITFMMKIPSPISVVENQVKESLWKEVGFGWKYLVERPGLLGLLMYFAALNYVVGGASVLFTPLILSTASSDILGIIMFIAGSGMIVGGIVMAVWGGLKDRTKNIYIFGIVFGIAVILSGLKASIVLVTIAGFLFFFSMAIIGTSFQTIFQCKVEAKLQGRVFSVRKMLVTASLPLAYITVGPLADNIFEPHFTSNGVLAKVFGGLVGVGTGRGIGLLLVIMGIITLFSTIFSFMYPKIKTIEAEIPDIAA